MSMLLDGFAKVGMGGNLCEGIGGYEGVGMVGMRGVETKKGCSRAEHPLWCYAS